MLRLFLLFLISITFSIPSPNEFNEIVPKGKTFAEVSINEASEKS